MIILGEWRWLFINLVCSPWCLAALVYCGMPADGTEVREGALFRRGNRHYQIYHTLWHFLSALGELFESCCSLSHSSTPPPHPHTPFLFQHATLIGMGSFSSGRRFEAIMISVQFISERFPDLDKGSPYLDLEASTPLVPALCLFGGFCVNMAGCHGKLMPVA
jgi:hypothetical protein